MTVIQVAERPRHHRGPGATDKAALLTEAADIDVRGLIDEGR